MPRGPNGEKRKADVIGNAVLIGKIATGEAEDNVRITIVHKERPAAPDPLPVSFFMRTSGTKRPAARSSRTSVKAAAPQL